MNYRTNLLISLKKTKIKDKIKNMQLCKYLNLKYELIILRFQKKYRADSIINKKASL